MTRTIAQELSKKEEGTLLQAISVPAKREAKGLLVVLHGWGANAQDVAALASYLNLPDYQFLFPDAPFPYPYAPQGRVWYNFPENFSFTSHSDFGSQPELQVSREALTEWLHSLEETTGIPSSRTILAGFSQGGAMTLDVGLRLPLAALLVLSGYLHAPIAAHSINLATVPKVFMVHGISDMVVPLSAALQARNSLISLNIPVKYEELNMGHEIPLTVLNKMQSFIEEKIELPDPS